MLKTIIGSAFITAFVGIILFTSWGSNDSVIAQVVPTATPTATATPTQTPTATPTPEPSTLLVDSRSGCYSVANEQQMYRDMYAHRSKPFPVTPDVMYSKFWDAEDNPVAYTDWVIHDPHRNIVYRGTPSLTGQDAWDDYNRKFQNMMKDLKRALNTKIMPAGTTADFEVLHFVSFAQFPYASWLILDMRYFWWHDNPIVRPSTSLRCYHYDPLTPATPDD